MQQELDIKTRSSIVLWLLSGCLLIFLMVVIGGITRLTGSGLSITKWDVVTGTIPPLSEKEWHVEFDHYKATPQYRLINSHFELHEFKQIYWWEYIHRLLGRLIGVVFLLPFLYFWFTGKLKGKLLSKCLILFGMGGLQGFIGWYMVKSGLVDIPSVSHLRLALHLVTAFITFGLTFWFAFELIHTEKVNRNPLQQKIYGLGKFLWVLTLAQIVYGAFVAGMKAGHIYNTWPLMGDSYIAESVMYGFSNQGTAALFNNMSVVQFIHRNLALLVTGFTLFILWISQKDRTSSAPQISKPQYHAVMLITVMVVLQVVLGIYTLLYNVPIYLGVIHQVFAFFLFASQLYFLHRMKYKEVTVR